MRISIKIVVFILILLSVGCNDIKFEKKGWMYEDCGTYPNRNKMIKDLTGNNKLIGLTYKELIKKIGKDDNYNGFDTCILYNIITDYGWLGIDPVYTKDLKFKFNKDSIVIDYKVEVWKE
jgi:hypothetical protein